MCEHLYTLDHELKTKGIKETYRGQAWSKNCREWVYYDCILDLDKLQTRYDFPDLINRHVNDDMKSGTESGFVCSLCNDAVMGLHPDHSQGKLRIE